MNNTTNIKDSIEQQEKQAGIQLPVNLRDYFAAKAMTAVAFHFQDRNNEQNCRHTAAHAYLMADAMMEAREA